MRLFKVKAFARWAESQQISAQMLKVSAREVQGGLVEASLGGGLYKKRLAVESRGKSSGARVIVGFKSEKSLFFIYGFLKNERENIDAKELRFLKRYAKILLKLSDKEIAELLQRQEIFEIK